MTSNQPDRQFRKVALIVAIGVVLGLLYLVLGSQLEPGTSSPSADEVGDGEWQVVETGSATGVITQGDGLGWDPSFGTPGWTPSIGDVDRFESALPAALAESGESLGYELSEYTRWYTGMVADETELLYVWFSCEEEAEGDALTRIPFVDGGGSCFWYASFDPNTRAIEKIRVNGPE